uniref:Uncharacterized protein n=1 Tax=Kalanchoe fedtschenkoi TaxID=63787 RepID=A0A7N0UKA4_KALFE
MESQEEGGWPLGLQPLNNAVGSISFRTTLLTASPTSSAASSSSDLDTESTGSFFHDRSITLGSLMGVRSILELPKRSVRGGHRAENLLLTRHSNNNNQKLKLANTRISLFSFFCSKTKSIQVIESSHRHIGNSSSNIIAASLGHQLRTERRAAAVAVVTNEHVPSPVLYGPEEIEMGRPSSETNSLFVNGLVAPPPPPPPARTCSGSVSSDRAHAVARNMRCRCGAFPRIPRLVLPCMCMCGGHVQHPPPRS